MRESRLYLQFIRDFGLLFVLFGLIGLIIAFYLLKQQPTVYVSERMYEFDYTLENAAAVEKQSEEVVASLRSPQLKEELRLSSSEIAIYKPGPFSIALQTKDPNAEKSMSNLVVLSGYLTGKYQVNQVGKEIFFVEPKPYFKYFIAGIVLAELVALLFSLIISYFKRY